MIGEHKVVLVVPGFCQASMFAATRAHLAPLLTPGVIDESWLLLNKYPLPSVGENEAALIEAASRFGYRVHDSGGDLGHIASIQAFLAAHPQPDDGILLSIDPDSVTDDAGFDRALCEVVATAEDIPVCALMLRGIVKPSVERVRVVAGHRVYEHPGVEMTNVGATRLDFYREWAGRQTKMWGGNELLLRESLTSRGASLGFLVDYADAFPAWLHDHRDSRYAEYKQAHYFGGFSGSFSEYLSR